MNPPTGTNAHNHPSPRKVGGAGAESHTASATLIDTDMVETDGAHVARYWLVRA